MSVDDAHPYVPPEIVETPTGYAAYATITGITVEDYERLLERVSDTYRSPLEQMRHRRPSRERRGTTRGGIEWRG